MLVTTEELSNFSGVHPENDNLQKIYIGTATDLIKTYVGFDPETNEDWKQDVPKVVIVYSDDGETFYIDSDMTIAATIPESVTPQPTLTEDEYEYTILVNEIVVPDVFAMVCLEIATLLQQEEDSNLGVNSKSFGDSGTRTFVNVVDYSKYLKRLDKYRKGDPFKF